MVSAPVSRIVDAEQVDGIAQFVVLMALRHARALPMYEAQQRERRWDRRPVAAVRSRVTVLGTGAMGSVVLRLLAAVGFDARGWSRGSAEPLEAVLGQSDIVVCALPLTVQTQPQTPSTNVVVNPPATTTTPTRVVATETPVVIEEHPRRSTLAIMATDALYGGLVGAAIGGAVALVFWSEPIPTFDLRRYKLKLPSHD